MTPELAREILQQIGDAVIVADLDGCITLWNEEARRLFGISADQVLGQPLPVVCPALLGSLGRKIVADFKAASHFDARRAEHPFRHLDGRVLWIDLQTSVFRGGHGLSPAFIALGRDITEEKQREQSHLSDELRLQTIINSVTDAIISTDELFRIVLINPTAEAMFDCAREEVLGHPMNQFAPLAETLAHFQSQQPAADGSSAKAVCILRGQRADGRTFPIEAAFSSVTVNERLFHTAVMRDVSRQEQMEQALIRTQKTQAVGTLASGIAHDFNNIFTAILSHLDLVALAPDFPAALKEYLAHAQTGARRGAEVVSKLQAFSNQSEPKLEPLDLGALIERVITIMRHSLGRGILVRDFQAPPRPAWVRADASQMMQVLVNLCLNARDAMPDGGSLTISLAEIQFASGAADPPRKPGEHVKITVADTGQGMSPEVLQRLFEPYFSTKTVGAGTGLGLSIAYSIVTEHGGWFEVESSSGSGSQFHIYLPCLAACPASPREEPAALPVETPPSPEGRETVLVVDDESAVRLIVRTVLAYRGYQVVEAMDGMEALEKCRQAETLFDLILVDLFMPRMNGWDVLSEIGSVAPRVPVVVMSGCSTDGEEQRAATLGARGFLAKPFDRAALLQVVRHTLDQARKP